MTAQAEICIDKREPSLGIPRLSFGAHVGSLKAPVVACVETSADYFQAAALYDELSRLSDAELCRRGLSRATLAWDVSQACDRTNNT